MDPDMVRVVNGDVPVVTKVISGMLACEHAY